MSMPPILPDYRPAGWEGEPPGRVLGEQTQSRIKTADFVRLCVCSRGARGLVAGQPDPAVALQPSREAFRGRYLP